MLYAATVLSDLIGKRMSSGHETEISMRILLELIETINYMARPSMNAFTFSLSEKDSLLSQWRSYTKHGKGISIGFSPELLGKICASSDLRIAKCLYREPEQIDLLDRLIDKILLVASPKIQEMKDRSGKMPDPVWKFLSEFHFEILEVLCVIKHPSFEEEREWRLIGVGNPGHPSRIVRFREGASMLVPYIELKLPQESPVFSEVVLGPTQHSGLSMTALGTLLGHSGLCNSTRNCLIPYREW